MKKFKLPLYMALALLLIPAMAFSQNTSQVEQYGDSNLATINQTGGDLLEALILQGEPGNDAFFNTATQNQTGGTGNIATITQVGANSDAFQLQIEGADNNALIEQNGTAPPNYNYAYQYQGTLDPTSANNFAYIMQTGEGNSATQWQDGSNNNSLLGLGTPGITQEGAFNSALQDQIGTNNLAWIQQLGIGNVATQIQYGDLNNSRLATPGIIQEGLFNTARQEQRGDDNLASINQNGSFNTAYQYQTDNSHDANVTQFGNFNYCSQTQSGVPKVSNVTQTGDGNSVTIVQN